MPTATPPTSTAAAIITSTRATASLSSSSRPAYIATTTRSPTSPNTSTTSTWRGSIGWWPTWRSVWRTSPTASWWTRPSPTRSGSAGSRLGAERPRGVEAQATPALPERVGLGLVHHDAVVEVRHTLRHVGHQPIDPRHVLVVDVLGLVGDLVVVAM